jgi:hypothetical protein
LPRFANRVSRSAMAIEPVTNANPKTPDARSQRQALFRVSVSIAGSAAESANWVVANKTNVLIVDLASPMRMATSY